VGFSRHSSSRNWFRGDFPILTRRNFTLAILSGLSPCAAPQAFGQTVDEIRAAMRGMPQLHSLQIQRGDDLLFAEAPRGRGLDRSANIKSCSKSIVALLLGTALDRREIPSIDSRLGDVAPDLIPKDATIGVADITIEDLATLRAGLAGTSGPNYGEWIESGDWVGYALRRPMRDTPGGMMIYSTGTTHVLGAVLAKATGQSLLALARDRIGTKLGFDIPAWTRDPQGFYLGGNEMALTPRAMLRIAIMMRDNGRYDGVEVIPEAWIRDSLQPRTRSPFSGLAYGYGWFLSPSGFVIARGYGGQVIAAHPGRRLAIAITSDPTRPARSEGYFGALMDFLDGPVLQIS
jgi:CubicO group peptidase (beta-lactamase class C family)